MEQGTFTINNGAWSLNANQWDGPTIMGSGKTTITSTGIMNVTGTLSDGTNVDPSFQCAMDSGKTVAVCTQTDETVTTATEIYIMVKAPSTSISLADLAGTWQEQAIEYQGPEWERGPMTLNSSGSITAYSITYSNGSADTTPSFSFAISGPDTITASNPQDSYAATSQCSLDADKTLMVCTAGGPSDSDAKMVIFLKNSRTCSLSH